MLGPAAAGGRSVSQFAAHASTSARLRTDPATLLWLALLVLMGSEAARAADVVVQGNELEGSVAGVTGEGVEFDVVYGEGTIVIPWANVEELRSDREFLVLYGDDEDVTGQLQGVEEGFLLVGPSAEEATRIPVDAIFRSLTREQYEESPLEALRARYRYWTATFDLLFAYTDATTDSTAFVTGLEIVRDKSPSRLTLEAAYRFGTTRESGEERNTTEDRIFGRARLDYDLFDAVFAFSSVSGEYNDLQDLSLRVDPTLGLGWRFIDRPGLTVAARSGGAWVYERYFGGRTDSYFSVVFGGDLRADLPFGSRLEARAEYLPAVGDWAGNYLIRTTVDWRLPILGWLDFHLAVRDDYENQPAPDTQHNSFISTAGLGARF